MSILRYRLGEILDRIRSEFGMEDDPENNGFIIQRINKALTWICRQGNGRFSFLRKESYLDVADGEDIVLNLTQGSRTATLVSGSLSKRAVVVVGASSDYGSDGYVVENVNGSTITFTRQYLGTTGTAVACQSMVGYIPLPEDFKALESKEPVSSNLGDYYTPVDLRRFNFIKQQSSISVGNRGVCCTITDPLREDLGTQYLAVYPYIGRMTSLSIVYYQIHQELINLDDDTMLPYGDRDVLLDASLWFVGLARGYPPETIAEHKNNAINGVTRLMEDSSPDDTIDFEDGSGNSTLDMSEVRDYDIPSGSDYSPPIV